MRVCIYIIHDAHRFARPTLFRRATTTNRRRRQWLFLGWASVNRRGPEGNRTDVGRIIVLYMYVVYGRCCRSTDIHGRLRETNAGKKRFTDGRKISARVAPGAMNVYVGHVWRRPRYETPPDRPGVGRACALRARRAGRRRPERDEKKRGGPLVTAAARGGVEFATPPRLSYFDLPRHRLPPHVDLIGG